MYVLILAMKMIYYIKQKSEYFAIGELFEVASRAEMFIGEGTID